MLSIERRRQALQFITSCLIAQVLHACLVGLESLAHQLRLVALRELSQACCCFHSLCFTVPSQHGARKSSVGDQEMVYTSVQLSQAHFRQAQLCRYFATTHNLAVHEANNIDRQVHVDDSFLLERCLGEVAADALHTGQHPLYASQAPLCCVLLTTAPNTSAKQTSKQRDNQRRDRTVPLQHLGGGRQSASLPVCTL